MEIDLTGRVALVTGGSKGLGLATAVRFAASGADVAIVARNPDTLEAALRTIRKTARGRVAGYRCDVSRADDILAAHSQIVAQLGEVDILVNNAGSHRSGAFEDTSDSVWQEDIDLKLMAPIRFSRLVLPAMKLRRWGRIINGLNIYAKAPKAGMTPTCVTRAAAMALSKALAGEGAPFNVLVNGLVVGVIDGDQLHRHYLKETAGRSYEEFLAASAVRLGVPLGRVGRAEEFANLACFLASDAASYITGAAINIDGGLCPVV
ncbi:MAG: SDR family oxidoreductase [Pseudomonadota bacterium]